ncbi:MAG: GSCFA domain-containing protein [Spirochaetales bacterium]|nr:GSCFA domain-containing protein [Spirochaetales bacterium]
MDKRISDFYLKQVTPVYIDDLRFNLSLKDSFFFAGSCFSNNLALWMKKRFIKQLQIPHGNIYNPLSLKDCIEMCLNPSLFNVKDIEKQDGLYFHTSFHSMFSQNNIENYIQTIEVLLNRAKDFLKKTGCCILTLGTAFVYQRKSTGLVVNNCHRLASNEFIRRKITIQEAVEQLIQIIKMIRFENPEAIIIFTLSPVRHLRDKATENSLSKAILRCAIEEIIDQRQVFYFPSYEIMLDELRDYRYYSSDLVHPSPEAIEYIMKGFSRICFSKEDLIHIEKLEKLISMFEHKALQPESDRYKDFIQKRTSRLKELKAQLPYLQWPEAFDFTNPP